MKNNNAYQKQILVFIISFFTILYLVSYCVLQTQVDKLIEESKSMEKEYNNDTILKMYRTNFILYKEMFEKAHGEDSLDILDVFSKEATLNKDYTEEDLVTLEETFAEDFASWQDRSELILNGFDVYSEYFENGSKADKFTWKNTDFDLEGYLQGDSPELKAAFEQKYGFYCVMNYDSKGNLSIDSIWSETGSADAFIKQFQHYERDYRELQTGVEDYGLTYTGMENLRILYAYPKNNSTVMLTYSDNYSDWYNAFGLYLESGGGYLYLGILFLICVCAFICNFIAKDKSILLNRKSEDGVIHYPVFIKYPTEISLLLIYCSFGYFQNLQYKVLYDSKFSVMVMAIIHGKIREITVEQVLSSLFMFVVLEFTLFLSFWSVYEVVPVFRVGLIKYLKEYSFCFHFLPWTKELWKRYTEVIRHVDFTKKANRIIFRIVLINFIILTIVSCFWFVGIPFLIVYSIVIYFLMRKYYNDISRDYQILLKSMGRIADGELDTEIKEDIGFFEPFKPEMGKIQEGFRKAVSEEVKSQKMKTELITNVSHDLKTPLTAITTYIELLQQENITEEQRKEYIDTLQNKTRRLTVLIEDLFEVSKATTNNITLNMQKVDIISLIRQTGVEFDDKFKEKNLKINYHIPAGKIYLKIDGQKTYRVFENLYGNIFKYALPGSRVYVDATETENSIEIVLRNVSAGELNFRAEEITERFVRGDASRNSEGSGLGLAIAKSFTELQGGKLGIVIDGDLFKVVINFGKYIEETENAESEEINQEITT